MEGANELTSQRMVLSVCTCWLMSFVRCCSGMRSTFRKHWTVVGRMWNCCLYLTTWKRLGEGGDKFSQLIYYVFYFFTSSSMTRLHTQSCLDQTSAAILARCVDVNLHDILCWMWRWISTCAAYWQCVSKRRTLVSVKFLVCAVISGLFRGAVVISSSFNLRKFWTTCGQCVRAFFGFLPDVFIVSSNTWSTSPVGGTVWWSSWKAEYTY